MVELQKQRVEQEMTKIVDTLDKQYLRKIQGICIGAQQNAVTVQPPPWSTHSCIENCGVPLNNANNYVQGELSHMQDKLQRCVMQCNDDIRDAMGPNPSTELADKMTMQFERCATKCVDKHIDSIPNLMKSMKVVLAQGAPSRKQS